MSQNESREYIVNNDADMHHLMVEVLSKLKLGGSTAKFAKSWVLALSGELGAGKTTFTKALASELGITEPVTSPTFVIQKSYQISTARFNLAVEKLVHIDAYRLESGADTEVLGLQETITTAGNLVVIEWAENIGEALPSDTIHIKFEYIDDTTRRVTIN